jgi:hypothetical protein
MTDFKFDLRRLSKNKKYPRDLVLPDFDNLTSYEGFDKIGPFDGIDRDVYWQHINFYYVAHSFDTFLFPNKQNLIQYLSWTNGFYDEGGALFCFSYRSFIESAAHFIITCMEIRSNFDKYTELLQGEKLVISSKLGMDSEWADHLKLNFLDPIVKAAVPTSVNWDALATAGQLAGNSPLSNSKNDPIKPQRIAKKMELLETHITGLRPTYDFLSEYIHPNSYPAQRFMSLSQSDNGSMIWQFRGSDVFSKNFHQLFNSLPSINSSLVSLILESEEEMIKIQNTLRAHTKVALKSYFSKINFKKLSSGLLDAGCMCRSGKKFRKCCGKS